MMFAKLFCRCSDDASVAMSPCKLQETSEKLEEKEFLLQGKVAVEIERAKEFAKAKNREAALRCLKRKKFYEEQIEHLWSFQMRIHDHEQKLLKKFPVIGGHPQQITSNGNLQTNTTRRTLRSAVKLCLLTRCLLEKVVLKILFERMKILFILVEQNVKWHKRREREEENLNEHYLNGSR
ncbi:hypothetical protein IEQ34_014922 [Dendrobium chrysotoxum]|uniref:Uncharacterized protein n=1 Tax=Dendrobium chrysotoxum TaxID=161865 RepID=A0AAV7GL99_DENCH|nr:hypothetical protein IEQ34_014922 [Dendrobium chrysotoxum]